MAKDPMKVKSTKMVESFSKSEQFRRRLRAQEATFDVRKEMENGVVGADNRSAINRSKAMEMR